MEMEHVNTLPLTVAVNTMSDEPGEVTEVLNCATNLQYMQHGDFRKDLNHMIGHMGTGGASQASPAVTRPSGPHSLPWPSLSSRPTTRSRGTKT